MKKIQLIYTVTGDYKGYFKDFLDSCKYFFPNVDKKITILSDGLDEYNGFEEEHIKVEKIKFYHLIYPTVNLNKPVFINDVMDETCDCVFYFDADTIFKNVPDYDWESLSNELETGKIIVSRHPMYALSEKAEYWGMPKQSIIDNFCTSNVTEKDSRFSSYIEESQYEYLITSFFGGKPKELREFNNRLIEFAQQDLQKYPYGYHIPRFMDENYANRIRLDSENNPDYDIKFIVGQYSELYDGKSDFYPTVFMYQKGMKNLKTNRR